MSLCRKEGNDEDNAVSIDGEFLKREELLEIKYLNSNQKLQTVMFLVCINLKESKYPIIYYISIFVYW